MSLYDIIRAGRVARWHANPDMAHIRETNAEHQWMVAVILLQLLPKDAAPLAEQLIFAALHHDVGEVIGDLPAPFKDRRPEVAALHAEEEAKVREEMGAGFWLTAEERDWLSLADRLAAWVHVAHHRPELLDGDGWPEAGAWISTAASKLGCGGTVVDLMRRTLRLDPISHGVAA
jgi:hypothetical protein